MNVSRVGSDGPFGANEDAGGMLPTQGEPATADLDEAGGAAAQHLDTNADANAEFGESPDPVRLARHVAHLGPFARTKAFER